ncbi:hypothetical protein H8K90_02365 [Winogradskyella echinorum]|uniref:Uncharacterized protein n=1 Tax=Winogradskyella echinorum TaxID=538189 RepID=A0ABR6XXH3_9FLAO|nr:hypothetical protein [Winogradskyella echinorum]MBC3845212.1 hypothetical protein [Winogradskyella echinorum]MBC5749560.1 hypothetical protein [Winogradskyella echinorum]
MKSVLSVLLIIMMQQAFSQNFSIDKIELQDTILITQIKKFISSTKKKKSVFENRGYVELRYKYVNKQTKGDELRYKISIKDQYYRPEIDRMICPRYYCYIEGKLVLIYDLWSDMLEQPKYKKRIKRKLKKLMKPYLDKPKHIKVRDSTGEIIINDKDFVPESFNIHGGITLSIFGNGEFKIEKGVY